MSARPPSVCVFCGSALGRDPRHALLAGDLGAAIAAAGARLVYGGGRVGLMGVVSDAVRDAGGAVFGVIPTFLERDEIIDRLSPVEVVPTLHDRKRRMAEESDGYVILPGGVGTLEEAIEVISWARLDLHRAPIAFLDAEGYWDGLFAMFHAHVDAGFTPAPLIRRLVRARDPHEAVRLALSR